MENLTWRCDICGITRPDSAISVLSYPLKGVPAAEVNLKYCNDNPECFKKAKEWSLTGEFPYEQKQEKLKKVIGPTLVIIFRVVWIFAFVVMLIDAFFPEYSWFFPMELAFFIMLMAVGFNWLLAIAKSSKKKK